MTVSDDGPGVPPGRRQSIFEADGHGSGGAGGLSLVRALVEAYGGDVWVADDRSEGATFVAELPRADVEGTVD